jgi:serine/threonine-protein kinase
MATILERPRGDNAASPAKSARQSLVLQRPLAASAIGPLLRRRLAIVAGLASATGIFFSMFRFSAPDQWAYFRATSSGTGLLIFEAAFCVTSVSLCALLLARSTWSLRSLRVVELGMVTMFAIYISWAQLVAWTGSRFVVEGSSSIEPFVVRQAVDSMAGRWVAVIVGFSTLVPETWRRNAALVAALALTAIGVTGYMSVADPAYAPHRVPMLSLMGFWMLIAGTIGIFGSYKLSELRKQVDEARSLGQYQLVRRIGSGAMGEVHLAEHLMLKQPCAIKLIRPELAADTAVMRRFEREVRVVSQLKHLNTVQIYDYGYADDGTFYYAMEYLPGLTLQQLVQRYGPIPPARAIYFLRQVCGALGEAHARHLLHRDIKPANVIACERGGVFDVAKLLDFGVASRFGLDTHADTLTRDGALVGTPAYMSPEQIRGDSALDARSDIYSVGAVGYFLVTGHPPFERSTAVQVLMAHVHDQPAPASSLHPDVPADLEAALMRCLAKAPVDRFPDAESLEQALSRCDAAAVWTPAAAKAWWQIHDAADAAGAVTPLASGPRKPAEV